MRHFLVAILPTVPQRGRSVTGPQQGISKVTAKRLRRCELPVASSADYVVLT